MVNSTKGIKINWKDVAKERFREITAYLDEKWPPYVSEKFFARTWFAIECIVKNPGRYRPSERTGIREAILHGRCILLYSIRNETEIEVLTFFDTRQHPSKKFSGYQ